MFALVQQPIGEQMRIPHAGFSVDGPTTTRRRPPGHDLRGPDKRRRAASGGGRRGSAVVIVVWIRSSRSGWMIAGPASAGHDNNSFRVPVIALDRGDDKVGVDSNQVDAGERHPHPCVYHDPLVEDAVEHIDETRATSFPLERHWPDYPIVERCRP